MCTRTQLGAERVAQELVEVGVRAAALHGNKQQGLRTNVLAGFRQGAFPVLVATEVAARGLHVDDVTMVVHVDPAADLKEYVHRSGRTARAGAEGTVVTLALPHQTSSTRTITAAAEVEPVWADVAEASDPAVAELGGREPSGEPADDPTQTKYKGAPRKLNLRQRGGADARRAQERRENEERRAGWEETGQDQRGRGGAGRSTRGGRGRAGAGSTAGGRGAQARGRGGRGGTGAARGGKGRGRGRSGAPTRGSRRRSSCCAAAPSTCSRSGSDPPVPTPSDPCGRLRGSRARPSRTPPWGRAWSMSPCTCTARWLPPRMVTAPWTRW